jgi:hypothetical protein
MNPKELYLMNMTEKNVEVKSDFIKCKEEIMKVIITNQYSLKLLR